MRLVHALSETPIGRAILACFFDLPRWALMNVLFALSLGGALWALLRGTSELAALLSLPAALVGAAMINMAARQVGGGVPRWRDVFAWPAAYLVAFSLWAAAFAAFLVFLSDPPSIIFFGAAAVLLALLMIGMFALCLPALLKVNVRLAWRNALVLVVVQPIAALGLIALMAVAVWAVWVTRGALILVVPALWVLITVFTVQDCIDTFQSRSTNENGPTQ